MFSEGIPLCVGIREMDKKRGDHGVDEFPPLELPTIVVLSNPKDHNAQ